MIWFIFIGIIGILIFFISKRTNKSDSLKEKRITDNKNGLIAQYEFFVTGTQFNAERVSRSRQRLLEELQTDDNNIIFIERDVNNPHDPNAIVVLNLKKEDLGYIRKEDQNKLLPYLDNENYLIIESISRFYENEYGINLVINVDILKN